MHATLSKCPVCAGALHVSELSCKSCSTQIRGEFESCRFCRLSPEQMELIELFLRNRGNLTGVGADLSISYPTVTKRLDAALAALGLMNGESHTELPPPPVVTPPRKALEKERAKILEMLDSGEITAEEATKKLQEI